VAQPALPRQPNRRPFLFFLRKSPAGVARRSGSPQPPAAGQSPPPSWSPAVTAGSPAPRLQNPAIKRSEAPPSHPRHKSAVSPLNLPHLEPTSRPQAIDGHGRRDAASSPLPGLYKHP
jgi:hypothetical protein